MNLVIVESPTKARKLAQYLGSGYAIEASIGHVRDLPKSKLGIDLDHDFEPIYEVDPNKTKVVKKLRQLAKDAGTIYLATDPDREGEAIAWHIQHLLSTDEKGKKHATDRHFVRSTFHEITKPAVLAAIAKPGEVSMPLVEAQQARRVVDRLVGYQVSPVLWKKVRRGLSAGRVQSVALRLIVEREREIQAFKAEEYWEVDVAVDSNNKKVLTTVFADDKPLPMLPPGVFIARVISISDKKYEPHSEADVTNVVADLKQANYVIQDVERKNRERVSLPPFTTSTLQQAAATRLGFTSKQTMTLAQQLYEEGLITYHRTDAVALSQQSITMARSYIEHAFGDQYVPEKPRYFANKSKNAQEAHEAIRVTDVTIDKDRIHTISGKFTDRHVKLYDLIWRRFIASQMNSAIYDQTSITVSAQKESGPVYTLRSSGSILKFAGWMKLFPSGEDVMLPAVEPKQPVSFMDLNSAQKFTQPPPRYNDASLVKELEKKGIGRPSTYASIISVIVDRGYVDRVDRRFTATAVGMTVNDFLMQHFGSFMDYDFTAEMEEDLDRISRGEKEWKKVVKTFYAPLAKTISEVTDKADRVQIPVEETGETCPLCGETEGGKIVIRSGKFGKFKSCSRFPDCKFTENIVEKVEGMKCPLCQQGDIIVKNSRWGKSFFGCARYPDCTWASWQKPEPGAVVTPEEWAIQQAAREERKAKRFGGKGGAKTKTAAKSKAKKASKKKAAKK